MQHNIRDFMAVVGVPNPPLEGGFTGVSKDTRTLEAGSLYVALRGDRFDGHHYVAQALAQGAAFALVEHLCTDAPAQRQVIVPDALQALQQYAAHIRAHATYKVIGVTGSVGKTSTKDMIVHMLSHQSRCYGTQGNYNNHIGLPLTILNAPPHMDYLVLEMGMNHAGEIAALTRIARPDTAVITAIEAAHIENFESIEGIAHAKAEMMQGMNAGATIALPSDSPHYALLHAQALQAQLKVARFGTDAQAQYRVTECQISLAGTHATITTPKGTYPIHIGAAGAHHARNAAASLALADALGLDMDALIPSFTTYREPKGRGTLIPLNWQGGTITMIDDTYNASPASMIAALQRCVSLAEGKRVIAVLGDMLELGTEAATYHAQLADAVHACATIAITTGTFMRALHDGLPEGMEKHHCTDVAAATQCLKDLLKPDDVVLCKGSRGSRMEGVITDMVKNEQKKSA